MEIVWRVAPLNGKFLGLALPVRLVQLPDDRPCSQQSPGPEQEADPHDDRGQHDPPEPAPILSPGDPERRDPKENRTKQTEDRDGIVSHDRQDAPARLWWNPRRVEFDHEDVAPV